MPCPRLHLLPQKKKLVLSLLVSASYFFKIKIESRKGKMFNYCELSMFSGYYAGHFSTGSFTFNVDLSLWAMAVSKAFELMSCRNMLRPRKY